MAMVVRANKQEGRLADIFQLMHLQQLYMKSDLIIFSGQSDKFMMVINLFSGTCISGYLCPCLSWKEE